MSIRVAIVDDHTLVRDALSDLISAEPDLDVVSSVAGASDALRSAAAVRPDVLLLDIGLPDGNGLDLIPAIHRRSPSTHVLILTMHSEAEYARAAQERGASGLVPKSAPIEELLEAIRDVASGASIPAEGGLTERERDVLARIAQGASNNAIAADLGLQPKTIESYAQQLMAKLGVRTRAGLIGYARRLGL